MSIGIRNQAFAVHRWIDCYLPMLIAKQSKHVDLCRVATVLWLTIVRFLLAFDNHQKPLSNHFLQADKSEGHTTKAIRPSYLPHR
jgi:hypothetical protein